MQKLGVCTFNFIPQEEVGRQLLILAFICLLFGLQILACTLYLESNTFYLLL